MYCVYTLYNRKHDKIYIGQTDNLEIRLKLHIEKLFKTGFTAKLDGEWELIYQENVQDRKEALIREKQLKSFRGRQFIRNHIPL